MFNWFMSQHWVLIAVVIAGLYAAVGLGGLSLTRRWILPRFGTLHDQNEVTGFLHHGILIVYGLAVALLAVAVWEKHSEVKRYIADEAVSIGVLYRDVTEYPEPARGRLQNILAGYTEQIIHNAWPLMQRGEVPTVGVAFMDQLQKELYAFEPKTQGQAAVHQETLRAYNLLIHARRLRVDSVDFKLAAPLWIVILIGGLMTIGSSWFFKVNGLQLQRLMVALLATTLGLLVFLIAYYDRPYRGPHGLKPEPYELIYEQLMKR